MNTDRSVLFLALALVASLLIMGTPPSSAEDPPATRPGQTERPLAVHVLALQDSQVPAEVAGRVLKRLPNESSRVRAGEPVVWLDDSVLRAAFRSAEAQVRSAEASLAWAKQERESAAALVRSGSLNKLELDRVQRGHGVALAAVEAARARAREAQTRLERAIIRAPFDGILIRIYPEVGEYMRPGDHAFRVVDDSGFRLVTHVPASLVVELRPGDTLSVRGDLPRQPLLRARVHSVAAAASPGSRTFRVEARLPKTVARWRAGMFGWGRFLVAPRRAGTDPGTGAREDGR